MKILSVILFFISTYSFAQLPLNLNDAINIALKSSYDIEVARNNAEANSINNNYGIAGGLPLVEGTASDVERVTDVNQKLSDGEHITRNGATANSATANIEGSILLYNGMRVISTKNRLEELEKQNREYLNATTERCWAKAQQFADCGWTHPSTTRQNDDCSPPLEHSYA